MYKTLLVSKTALDIGGIPKHYLTIPKSTVIDCDKETSFEPIPVCLNRRRKQNLFSKESNYNPKERIPVHNPLGEKSYPTTPSKRNSLNFFQKTGLPSGSIPLGFCPAHAPAPKPIFYPDFYWNRPLRFHSPPKMGGPENGDVHITVQMRNPLYYTFCRNQYRDRRIGKNYHILTEPPTSPTKDLPFTRVMNFDPFSILPPQPTFSFCPYSNKKNHWARWYPRYR